MISDIILDYNFYSGKRFEKLEEKLLTYVQATYIAFRNNTWVR